jgi:tight adherence protein C
MTLAILLGLVLFIALLFVFLLLLPHATPESALLHEVARPSARYQSQSKAPAWRAAVSADILAKPFSTFRRFFTSEPDPELVRKLMLAGYRRPSHADIFLGARLVLPVILGFAAALVFSNNVIFYFIMAIVLGFFLPDLWLGRAINKRRERIKLSLPDALDMLAICMEAGLGLDQGIVRIGQELRVSHPELSEEFLQINFEQRAGAPRLAAWKDFADRANIESVRSFVAMLIQTDRFGTPISKSLGNFSDALRTQRRQKAEEMAAKTTIKLVPPLVFFIFPSIGIVVVGPAVITVMKNITHIVG